MHPRTRHSKYTKTEGDRQQGHVCKEVLMVFFCILELFLLLLSVLPFPISDSFCRENRPSSSSGDGGTIYRNNEVDLYMAIADLSHAENIPFNIGESNRFRKVITLERTVGPDYCPPDCNIISGEMLDLSWNSYWTKTTKYLMAEEDVFGIVFLRYLARIKGRTIIRIIVSLFKIPVAVLVVKDCSKHLS